MLRNRTFGGGARALYFGIVALGLAGCGSGDDDDAKCTPLDVSGEWLFASGMGDGKVHGKGSLPSTVKDGMELELLLTNQDGFGASVFPDNFLATTCGPSFTFHVRGLDPATYQLGVSVYPSDEDSDSVYDATSTNSFAIVGSEDVEFNPTF
jgi:hypothetical protein